jgi:hypothetical protein
LAAAPVAARRLPQLAVEGEDAISWRAPRATVTIADLAPGKQLNIRLLLNGEEVGQRLLANGRHRVLLESSRLAPGRHVVEVRSGTLIASDEFEVGSSWPLSIVLLVGLGAATFWGLRATRTREG